MNKLIIGFIFFASLNVSAAEVWTNGQQLVSNIIWRPSHHGFYVKSSDYHNPQNCGNGVSSNLYVFHEAIEADEKTMDQLFTLMTTAMVANLRVHVLVDGCRGNLPKIKGLQLNK